MRGSKIRWISIEIFGADLSIFTMSVYIVKFEKLIRPKQMPKKKKKV